MIFIYYKIVVNIKVYLDTDITLINIKCVIISD